MSKKFFSYVNRKKLTTIVIAASLLIFLSSQNSFAQLAAGKTKFLGSVIGTFIPKDYLKYWDQVTPENDGKLGNAEPEEGKYHLSGLDSIYNYAVQNNIPFKFHNLVWGKQQPKWIAGLDSTQQVQKIKEWIEMCGRRYPKSAFVDVVNEPIKTSFDTLYPPYYKAIGGEGKTGWDWVIWSFEQARKNFPHSKLILNEYDILNGQKPIDKLLDIVKLLKERNLIDGVGIQGHFIEKTDSSSIRKRLYKVASLGLPIYISEYDCSIADDSAQLEKYKEQFPIFWECPEVKGVTLWGYKQNIIWRTDAYLVRADGSERPALKWLESYVKNSPAGK